LARVYRAELGRHGSGDDRHAWAAQCQRRLSQHQADTNDNFPLLVWQPTGIKMNYSRLTERRIPNFDSSAPTYKYMYPATAGSNATLNFFNNLDETSEIGLCLMFAHYTTNKIRVAYEAKSTRTEFDYANKNIYEARQRLYDADQRPQTDKGQSCPTWRNMWHRPSIVSLPCGDAAVAGDAGEGAIEIKAAWRQLTAQKAVSGRFFYANGHFLHWPAILSEL